MEKVISRAPLRMSRVKKCEVCCIQVRLSGGSGHTLQVFVKGVASTSTPWRYVGEIRGSGSGVSAHKSVIQREWITKPFKQQTSCSQLLYMAHQIWTQNGSDWPQMG